MAGIEGSVWREHTPLLILYDDHYNFTTNVGSCPIVDIVVAGAQTIEDSTLIGKYHE